MLQSPSHSPPSLPHPHFPLSPSWLKRPHRHGGEFGGTEDGSVARQMLWSSSPPVPAKSCNTTNLINSVRTNVTSKPFPTQTPIPQFSDHSSCRNRLTEFKGSMDARFLCFKGNTTDFVSQSDGRKCASHQPTGKRQNLLTCVYRNDV